MEYDDEAYIRTVAQLRRFEDLLKEDPDSVAQLPKEDVELREAIIAGVTSICDTLKAELEEYRSKWHEGCVQCGYCCTKRSCGYGIWLPNEERCQFLTDEKKCELYDFIREREEGCEYPMFDNYCSSSLFNTVREAKIKDVEDAE